jgi:hypothetical protein
MSKQDVKVTSHKQTKCESNKAKQQQGVKTSKVRHKSNKVQEQQTMTITRCESKQGATITKHENKKKHDSKPSMIASTTQQ